MHTVLVVEDEFHIRWSIAEAIKAAGFAVIEAEHADEAILILEARQDVHLVFTDVNMPGSIDGLRLAAAVRDRWPPVHIIVTSGLVKPTALPVDAIFIPKPYLSEHVLSAIWSFER